MKLRPTQTRGGRVEVGRKNSRERPLFAEPDKAGNKCLRLWGLRLEIKAIELHLESPTLRSNHPEKGS